MYVVATLFRHKFWTIFTKADSRQRAERYANICRYSRFEPTRIVKVDEWDKESAARDKERIEIAKRDAYLAGAA